MVKKKVGRPKKEKTEVLYLRVPHELAKQVRCEAVEEDREIYQMILRILRNHFEGKD